MKPLPLEQTEAERLTREAFAEAARLAESTPLGILECLDCGKLLREAELVAQACPVCDGRVKDL